MQLTPSLVPSDPTLLATVLPGMGAPRIGAPAAEGRATTSGTFGELFPELGVTATEATTAIPVSVASLPLPVGLPTSFGRLSEAGQSARAALPASTPSLPKEMPLSGVAALDEQALPIPHEEAAGVEPRASNVERRSPAPSSRRFAEKHREPNFQDAATAPEKSSPARADADLIVIPSPAQPVPPAPAPEPITVISDAGWERESAAPLPTETTTPAWIDRPLPFSQRADSLPEIAGPQIMARAGMPGSRELPTIASKQESPPAVLPVLTASFRAPFAPPQAATSFRPAESRGEEVSVTLEPSTPGATTDAFSTVAERKIEIRSAAIPTVSQSERAAQPEPVARTPLVGPMETDTLGARPDSVGILENFAVPVHGEQPLAPVAKRPRPLTAKFAPEAIGGGTTTIGAPEGAVKTFVSAEPETLTRWRPELGIGVAKPAATMLELLIPALPTHPVPEYGMVASALEARFEPAAASVGAPLPERVPVEAVSSAQRAVEVALRAVDIAAAGTQKSVNLDFAVGDADLNVRIEIRAEEVHTTFRTDSAELRTALAQEWQAIAASPAAERGLRLAPASFASADAPALNASGGDASSRERHSQAQQSEHPPVAFTSAGRARAAASDHSVSAAPAIRSLVAAATSRHLHTLA